MSERWRRGSRRLDAGRVRVRDRAWTAWLRRASDVWRLEKNSCAVYSGPATSLCRRAAGKTCCGERHRELICQELCCVCCSSSRCAMMIFLAAALGLVLSPLPALRPQRPLPAAADFGGRRRAPLECIRLEEVVSPFAGSNGAAASSSGPLELTMENVDAVLEDMRP